MPKEEVTFDKIRAWVNNKDAPELSEAEKRILDRWDYVYDQLKIEKQSAVVNRLMKKYNIKISQAYYDIRNAQKLFNPINRRETDWLRNFIVEDALLQIKAARETNDAKAWQKARLDLIKVYALDKADKDGIDPELLGRNNYYVLINVDNTVQKVDMNKVHELPVDKRLELTSDLLYKELESEEEVDIIMNS